MNTAKRIWTLVSVVGVAAILAFAFYLYVQSGRVEVPLPPVEHQAVEQPHNEQLPPPKQAVLEGVGGKSENGTWQMGYSPNPEGTAQFLKALPKPTLSQAGPELLTKARDDQPVLLYRALYDAWAAHKGGDKWRVGKQGIGDCVSWGWKHGADIHLAVLWKLNLVGEWKEAATESIYGGSRVEARGVSRGGYSDGSYGSAAAKWVKGWGCVFRQDYPDLKIDLSVYSSSRAKQWGNFGNGGEGDSDKFDAIAKEHPIKGVALVRTFEEAAAAIQSGYPVPVCSGQGFSSSRDKDGYARATGRWAHCMCFIGVRYGDRPGLLCLNSWGPSWIDGPKWPEDQPDGSFWVDKKVVDSMLSGNDSFAVSGYEGFPHRELHHGDWVALPQTTTVELADSRRKRRTDEAVSNLFSLSP